MQRVSAFALFRWIAQQERTPQMEELMTLIADNTPIMTTASPSDVTIGDSFWAGRPDNLAQLREAFKVPEIAKAWALDVPEQGPVTVWWEG